METSSVHEILLKHGKWIGSSRFVSLVAGKRKISRRQAYNLIKRSLENKQIRKHIFPDRTVIYGVTEFGPPSSAGENRGLKTKQFWGDLKEIENEYVNGNISKAWEKASLLWLKLASPHKEQIAPSFNILITKLEKDATENPDVFLGLVKRRKILKAALPYLIAKLSEVGHKMEQTCQSA